MSDEMIFCDGKWNGFELSKIEFVNKKGDFLVVKKRTKNELQIKKKEITKEKK
jgi:hypothetical protein